MVGTHAAEGLSSRKKNLPSFSPASVSHKSDLTHSTSSPFTLHANGTDYNHGKCERMQPWTIRLETM